MANDEMLLDALARAVAGPGNDAARSSTHAATVTRLDPDGTMWVSIPGGANETPVRTSLVTAEPGDVVQVTIADGRATATGNESSPAANASTVTAAVEPAIQAAAEVKASLVAESAKIAHLEADTAKVHDLTADQLTAAVGYIDDLTSASVTAEQLAADHATVGSLDANYAQIGLANVNTAQITNGIIQTASIVDEQVFTVSGNKATIARIDASKINVENLNADNITVNKINGQTVTGKSISDALSQHETDISTKVDTTTFNNAVDDLNDRIDGAIETFTGTVVPTLNNTPASAWNTTKLRDEHVGDVYYVVNSSSQQNGYCYRFTKSGSTYSWQLIKDSDVTAALSRLQTAEGKITTFDSDISTLKTDTGELKTKTQSLETSLGDKVDVTTFNDLSSDVEENSATITTLSNTVSQKADSSTVTTLSNTVNQVKQTADTNKTSITNLTQTVNQKADSSTVTTLTQRTSTIEQNLDGITTRISATESSISGHPDCWRIDRYSRPARVNTNNVVPLPDDFVEENFLDTRYRKESDMGTNLQIADYYIAKLTTYVHATESTTITDNFQHDDASAVYLNDEHIAEAAGTTVISVTLNLRAGWNKIRFLLNENSGSDYARFATRISTWSNVDQQVADLNEYEGTIQEQRLKSAETSIEQNAEAITLRATKAEFDALSIGGRNLWGYGSECESLSGMTNSGWNIVTESGYTCAHTSGALKTTKALASKIPFVPKPKEIVTVSGYILIKNIVRGTTNPMCEFYLSGQTIDGSWRWAPAQSIYIDGVLVPYVSIAFDRYSQLSDEKWHHFAVVCKWDNAEYTVNCSPQVYIRDITGDVYARHLKYERGNRATDWTPAPEDMATAAELKVANDNINLKVSKNDVINQINVSTEGATIDADRVNITGATIFTSGRLSQTSLNNAYDPKGAASTAETNAKNYVDNLEIGGRNLLLKSSDLSKGAPLRTNLEVSRYSSSSTFVDVDGKYFGVSTSAAWQGIYAYVDSLDLSVGDLVTFSCRIRTTNITGRVQYYTMAYNSSGTRTYPNTKNASSAEPTFTTGTSKKLADLVANTDIGVWLTMEWTQEAKTALDNGDAFRMSFQTYKNLSGDGAVIFYAPKLEKGNKATDWSPAPEDQEAYVDTKVGGRNYILRSAGLNTSGLGSAAGSSAEYRALNVGQSYMSIAHGTQVTISFDLYMTVNTANPSLNVYNTNNKGPKSFSNNPSGTGNYSGVTLNFTAAAGTVIDERVSVTGYINDRTSPALTTNWLEFYSNYGTSNWFSISNLKMEIGSNATAWSPAPEDAVKRTQRIYYRKTVTGVPAAPSSWVVSSGDGSNAWTQKHISINREDKYIYTCEQYEMADGTLGNTSILLDDTITVIDGGKILTGTVEANALKAKSLSLGYFTDAAANSIDNSKVQVGGRNLLPYSKPSADNMPKVSTANATNTFVTEDGFDCYKGTGAGTSFAFYASNGKLIVPLEASTQYIYSAWVKLTTTTSATSVPLSFSSLGHFTVRNENSTKTDKTHEDVAAERVYSPSTVTIGQWTKITLTFTTNELAGSHFGVYSKYNYGTEYTLFIRDMKLEKGNKATDWTPAPEDVDNSIFSTRQDFNDQIDPINESIETLSNGITDQGKRLAATEDLLAQVKNMVDNLENTTSWLSFNEDNGLIIGDNPSDGSSFFYTQQKGSFMSFNQMTSAGSQQLMMLSGTNGVEAQKVTAEEVVTSRISSDWAISLEGDMFSIDYIGN